MGCKKEEFIGCIGTVTIVTEDLLVFQGQIVKEDTERHHHEEEQCLEIREEVEFIRLRLTCDPALIKENARIEEIEPDLFEEGDVIRINVNEILVVGPSRECLGDDPPRPNS